MKNTIRSLIIIALVVCIAGCGKVKITVSDTSETFQNNDIINESNVDENKTESAIFTQDDYDYIVANLDECRGKEILLEVAVRDTFLSGCPYVMDNNLKRWDLSIFKVQVWDDNNDIKISELQRGDVVKIQGLISGLIYGNFDSEITIGEISSVEITGHIDNVEEYFAELRKPLIIEDVSKVKVESTANLPSGNIIFGDAYEVKGYVKVLSDELEHVSINEVKMQFLKKTDNGYEKYENNPRIRDSIHNTYPQEYNFEDTDNEYHNLSVNFGVDFERGKFEVGDYKVIYSVNVSVPSSSWYEREKLVEYQDIIVGESEFSIVAAEK